MQSVRAGVVGVDECGDKLDGRAPRPPQGTWNMPWPEEGMSLRKLKSLPLPGGKAAPPRRAKTRPTLLLPPCNGLEPPIPANDCPSTRPTFYKMYQGLCCQRFCFANLSFMPSAAAAWKQRPFFAR